MSVEADLSVQHVNPEPVNGDKSLIRPPKDLSATASDSEVNQFRESFESPAAATHQLSTFPQRAELIVGAIMLAAWFSFFSGGLFVPTHAYRDQLLKASNFWEFVSQFGHFLIVVACYTVTNLLFLACTASYLGCMTLRWRISSQPDQTFPLYSEISPRRIYAAAILRSFFLYLLVISGLLIFSTEDAIVNTGFAQYIRMAGVVSALAFTIGYDPLLINRFLGRLEDLANTPLRKE